MTPGRERGEVHTDDKVKDDLLGEMVPGRLERIHVPEGGATAAAYQTLGPRDGVAALKNKISELQMIADDRAERVKSDRELAGDLVELLQVIDASPRKLTAGASRALCQMLAAVRGWEGPSA